MPNRTDRRGRGFPPKRITITAADGLALRTLLMDRHGYSAEEALSGILSGEVKTVLINDAARLAAWLLAQTTGDVLLDEELHSLARQLAD